MSELQPLARGDVVGPEAALPPAKQEGGGENREGRQTFWAVVGRAYWRGLLNRIATGWVVLILLLTVVVPFLANDAPYTAVMKHFPVDAAGNPLPPVWVREWPLFRDLTRVDWIWLAWGGVAVGYGLLRWTLRTGRGGRGGLSAEEEERRRYRHWMGTGILLAAGIVASIGIAVGKHEYLDSRDYHQLVRQQGNEAEMRDAVFPPLRWGYAQQEPLEAAKLFMEPGGDHLLGTDGNGRDVLARLLWGARVVLEIGFVSEIISLVIGAFYGAMMGYFVGKVDLLGMRFVEIVEAVPLLFLLITVVAVFGRQLFMIMVIIGATGWTGIARFVRAEFLRIRQMDYVAAAKAMGLPLRNILFRHMLPNGLTPVIVSVTFGVAGNIVSESILSFLGIGVEPPTASWGAMLADAGDPGVVFRWWLALAPGLMIFLTVFAYNIIGEGLRDAIDPRLNKIE
ncbi:MAG TPA: ABC transporter permease [Phycisphaerae bacterium]|nr:ABC transporter permease [Phycisphaerae bacterium]